MTTPTLDTVRERVARMNARYDAHFAGQPRHSRDPELLDKMAEEAQAILSVTRSLSGDEANDISDKVKSTRELYLREAAEIRDIQDAEPEVFMAYEYRTWARLVFDRYRRNFAGKGRATRDLGLLGEMIQTLETIHKELSVLAARLDDEVISGTREVITENLELYQRELRAIAVARSAGTLNEQADMLAEAANAQFTLYAHHFAEKPRLSRNVGRLERLIEQLTQICERMSALDAQGLRHDPNVRNIQIIGERLALYENEVGVMRETRQQTDLEELVHALGQAANETFSSYRKFFANQTRTSRDLTLLNTLCEELYDLGQQMDALDGVRENATNQHNLAVVLDHLRMYNREYAEIGKEKARS